MSALLPVVNAKIIDSIDHEMQSRGAAAFLIDSYRKMASTDPVLSGYITGYLQGLLSDDDSSDSLPFTSMENLAERFERGDQVALALSGVCLAYRLLESQAEVDQMHRELKLD